MRNIYLRSLVGLLLLLVAPAAHGFAQEPASEKRKTLQAEIEALKEGQAKIRQELQEIKALLRRARAAAPSMPKNLVLSVDGDPFKGDPKAPVTLIEFSDYQCPFCARHVRQALPQIERDYIATGKVKYVFRDFPITSIHKQAFKAAEAANCAGAEGKYWEMHDRLFDHQKALNIESLDSHALAVGLDLAIFQRCLKSGITAKEIRDDMAEGQKAGVRGTPTFFIGRTNPSSSSVKVLRMVRGAQAYANFKQVLDSVLATQKSSSDSPK